ncbi:OmpH family outer membrane protein [Cloacibacillus sp. An23]|uniref:OmpH family outer membrane protein n=1 Tax=Cloacibacillus sp. An23 TaxID=1965591 RepID=UPI000B3A88B7|nr:OmpH family outer membrane protein [Cloacibacillus sp. An23]OUO92982.1 HlpA protein [Cloacibacillus sp. An23]
MALKKTLTVMLAALSALVLAGSAFAADVVGTIDTQQVMFQHPKFQQVQRQVRDVTDKLQKEAQTAIDKESDNKKKADIYQAKRQELAQEERKLMEPLFKEINLAMRTVANQKKLTVVMDKGVVFYGGVDITNDVITELKKSAK